MTYTLLPLLESLPHVRARAMHVLCTCPAHITEGLPVDGRSVRVGEQHVVHGDIGLLVGRHRAARRVVATRVAVDGVVGRLVQRDPVLDAVAKPVRRGAERWCVTSGARWQRCHPSRYAFRHVSTRYRTARSKRARTRQRR